MGSIALLASCYGFAPDFFGNPGVGNAWQPNYAEFLAYFGIVTRFLPSSEFVSEEKQTDIFFSLPIGLSLLFALPTPFSQALTVLHIPVLDTGSPARILLSFSSLLWFWRHRVEHTF